MHHGIFVKFDIMIFHFKILLFVTLILNRQFCTSYTKNDDIKFSAITDSPPVYVNKTYLEKWNEDTPSILDPAITDLSVRLQICNDITYSGVFGQYGKTPVNLKKWGSEVYSTVILYNFGVVDTYVKREFKIKSYPHLPEGRSISIFKKEYVFPCVVRETGTDNYSLFFVSKLYNAANGFSAHRFLFPDGMSDVHKDVMLVEGSAKTYKTPGFNVELHYLELRKNYQPASRAEFDPVCKLNGSLGSFKNDQSFRLCATVMTSPVFKKKFQYPKRVHYKDCFEEEVSFKTEEGEAEATGKLYREHMLYCYVHRHTGGASKFYISRAYNPNQVFVYGLEEKSFQRKFYLEYLCTDVNIVLEFYNFGELEI